jgi:hypothetical protein
VTWLFPAPGWGGCQGKKFILVSVILQTQEGHKNAVKISMRCLSERRLPQLTAWAGLFCSILLLHVVYIGIYEIVLKWRQSSSHASGFIQHYQSARNLARSIEKPVSRDALVTLKEKTVELAQIKKAHAELADELRWSVVELQRLEPLEDVVFLVRFRWLVLSS